MRRIIGGLYVQNDSCSFSRSVNLRVISICLCRRKWRDHWRRGGAVAGAVVGGPVGAVVGGVGGAAIGNSMTNHRHYHRGYAYRPYHHYDQY